jgi:AraC-like DNA-binding protein
MSTAPAPDARPSGTSRMRAVPALSAPDGGSAGATIDTITPGATLPTAPDVAAPELRRGHMAGTDLDEAVARYAALYPGGAFHAAPPAGDFSYRYSYVGDAHVSLRSSAFLAEHWGRLPALPDHVVVWWREGSGVVDCGPHEMRSSGSRPMLLPFGRAFDFRFQAGVQNLVQIDAAFLDGIVAEAHGGRPRPVVFDHTRPPAPERTSAWRRAVGEASPVLQDVASSPLLRMQAGLLIARATLTLFPWHDVPFSAELRAPRMSAVRTAIEYMHHHADRPITPADAARAAGISTRVLQLAVRRHEDTTPSALLRGIRLDRVRVELRDASPASTTVRAVAEQWGFGHLGRFAASYEERFGELPSATLRR